MNTEMPTARRPRTLALRLVEVLGERIRDGRLAPGDKLPTEAAVMAEFGVSRTVVREAISKLQAAGMVETRHGIGTFVVGAGDASAFRIEPQQLATLRDVIAVLELRIGIESEAAGCAAGAPRPNLAVMRSALDAFAAAVEEGRDAVAADFQFHTEIARATQNEHFAGLLRRSARRSFRALGSRRAPRWNRRSSPTCGASTPSTRASTTPLRRRTPRRRARRCARTWPTAASAAAGPSRRLPEGYSRLDFAIPSCTMTDNLIDCIPFCSSLIDCHEETAHPRDPRLRSRGPGPGLARQDHHPRRALPAGRALPTRWRAASVRRCRTSSARR